MVEAMRTEGGNCRTRASLYLTSRMMMKKMVRMMRKMNTLFSIEGGDVGKIVAHTEQHTEFATEIQLHHLHREISEEGLVLLIWMRI